MFKRAGMAAAAVLLFTAAGLAQEDGRFDFNVSWAAALGKQSSGHGIILNSTNSGAPLLTFRFRFNPKHSILANYSATHDGQVFTVGTDVYRIQSSVSEFSGAYVYNPIQIGKFEPFVLAGAGSLHFSPGSTYINTFPVPVAALKQTELAVSYGAGVDYRVVPHIAVRLQYRGLFYKVPDFKNLSFFTGALGHMAEPSVGVVFRF